MDLLDRYLHAVRIWLPRAQQDDITAELAEDLRSQIEDQETKLGRKLTDPELEAILKQRGRPMLVANGYLPQQYLIGPLLFPVYRFVLIIVTLCYLVPWMLTWIGLAIFDPHFHADFGRTFGPLWGTFWVTTFVALGTVTLVFAILERVQPNLKFLEDWDPRKLPPVRDPNRIPRLNSIIEVGVNAVFVMWWLNGMWSQTIFDRAGVRIVFAPVWRIFFWVFLLLAIANIALAVANLFRPYWTWLRAGIQLALTCAGAIAFCWICKASILAQIVAPNLSSARAAEVVNLINTNVSKSFPFAVIACVLIVALSGVGRLVRMRTSRRRLIHGVAAL
jgi:hypothetical protein